MPNLNPMLFAVLMQRELDANAPNKGPFEKWKPTADEALTELRHHHQKLKKALAEDEFDIAIEFAIDCANICMKIAEMAGAGNKLVDKLIEL